MIPVVVPGGPLAVLAELLFNRSQFTGKEISKDIDKPVERAAKVLDHLYKSMAPNLVGLPGTYATKSVIDAATGRTDSFGREQSATQALLSSVGIKVASYPRDVMERGLRAKRDHELREIGENMTSLRREYERKGINQAEFEKRMFAQAAKKETVNREYAGKLQ